MNNLPTIDTFNEDYYICDSYNIVYSNIEKDKYYIVDVINDHNDYEQNRTYLIKIVGITPEHLVTESKYVFSLIYDKWVIDMSYDTISIKPKDFIVANTKFYKYKKLDK